MKITKNQLTYTFFHKQYRPIIYVLLYTALYAHGDDNNYNIILVVRIDGHSSYGTSRQPFLLWLMDFRICDWLQYCVLEGPRVTPQKIFSFS